MAHYLLRYTLADDYLERRVEFRGVHLTYAWAAADRNELLLGGAMEDPGNGAMLLFKGDSAQVAESFARSDPYVLNGLVTAWRVDRWVTVVGKDASEPIRP